MRRDAGTTDSLWTSTKDVPDDGPLEQDTRADVCIVGAGVVGLCTAYALMQDGRDVVVLDDGPVGGGETGRTTAHISHVLDDRFWDLQRIHGSQGVALAAQSHAHAVDWLERVVRAHAIACNWHRLDGYLFQPEGHPPQRLEREMVAAREAGIEVEKVDRVPLGASGVPGLRFPGQARLDPTRFLAGMATVLRQGGVRIHTPSHATRVEDDGHVVVTGTGQLVRCDHVIEATNAPVFGHASIFMRQSAHRTYAIAAAAPADATDALFWDTDDPYHYVRLAGKHMIIGGGDHPTGQAADSPFVQLEAWARARVPGLGAVSHRWSGQVWEPGDGLAFIGRSGDTLIATGDSGQGWTHAAIAAQLLSDIVAGRSNPFQALYDPERKAGGASSWLKETKHMLGALPRHLMAGEVDDKEMIAAGQAAIVRRGIRLFACHRDEEGVLHERSAVCRHMGCIVAWNPTESSWDCPCHGSRYDRLGTVINGPANQDLSESGPHADGIRQRDLLEREAPVEEDPRARAAKPDHR